MRYLTLLALTVGLLAGPAPIHADAATPKARSAPAAAKTAPARAIQKPKANTRKLVPATAVKSAQEQDEIEDKINFEIESGQSTGSGEQRLRGAASKKQEDSEKATLQRIK